MKNLKLLLPIVFLLFATSASAEWNKNAEGTSATTVPSPYQNDSDFRETLSISDATMLKVTVTGVTESGYDFLYITDADGNTKKFDGTIDETFTVLGSAIAIRFTSDYSVTRDGVTVTIADATPPSPDFTLINPPETRNILGDYVILGNTIECITRKRGTDGERDSYDGACQDHNGFNDNFYMARYIDIDDDDSTWNSSSSDFTLPTKSFDNKDPKAIVWAGLFWQGSINNAESKKQRRAYRSGDGYRYFYIDSSSNIDLTQTDGNTVEIKVDKEENYATVTADTFFFDTAHGSRGGYYAAFADITSLLQNKELKKGKHTITIANLTANEGRQQSIGNYGGWSIVVIYKEKGAFAHARNISIFNGFKVISSTRAETIKIEGFKLPTAGTVSAQFASFAGEGEWIYGKSSDSYDRMVLGTTSDPALGNNMPGAIDPDNIFDAILANIDRNTTGDNAPNNNNGIDIDNYDVSTLMTTFRNNDPEIDTVYVSLSSSNDYVTPSMMAFSAELYTPKLCYDCDVRIGERIKLPSSNLEIHTHKWGSTPLGITMLLRSELSDFPIENSKLNVTFTPLADPATHLSYNLGKSKVSPPDINAYFDIDDLDASIGQIGIGRGATDTNGGTIGAFESTYAKQYFSFENSRFDGKFDINIEGTLELNDNVAPIPFSLSTGAPSDSSNYIGRCKTNPIYDTIWADFNIEREDSRPTQPDEIRYPLYTQITGKDFNISIASYQLGVTSGKFDEPLDTNTTVELEIIDASVFENNASVGYDSTCEEPGALGEGAFIRFAPDGVPKSRAFVSIPDDIPGFDNDIALQSAAFRIWVLATKDINGTQTIVNHDCTTDVNDTGYVASCFKDLYRKRIESYDTESFCQSDCKNTYTPKGCYKCLRIYFAKPICSRDNFSIRPESFRIQISDNNETNNTQRRWLTDNSRNINPTLTLAAGYNYAIDINATLYTPFNNTIPIAAKGYYNDYLQAAENLSTLGDKTKNNMQVAMEFTALSGTSCADTTHQTYRFRFQDGKTGDKEHFNHKNVGNYNFWILDSNWTNVDQASYPHKVPFGKCQKGNTHKECYDCDILNPSNSTRNGDGKLGCVINSNLNDTLNPTRNDDYIEIPLDFEPYRFGLSDINLTTPNGRSNFVYMNDVNTTNIINRDMAVRFIGSLVAQNKGGSAVSNFTTGCVANDVVFDINFSTSRCGIAVTLASIKTESSTPRPVPFRLNYIDSATINTQIYDRNESNASSAVIVSSTAFKNEDNGSTKLKLYYNFKRPRATTNPLFEGDPVNPVEVLFETKEANSTASASSAHLSTNFIPSGKMTINQSIDFLFARVITQSDLITIPKSANSIIIPFYLEAYCKEDNASCCNNSYALPTDGTTAGWKLNMMHTDNDGQILTIGESNPHPAPLAFTPNTPISLNGANGNNPARITFTIPAATHRTYNSTIGLTLPPWLGAPGTNTSWLGGGGWAGTGKTGLIVDTNASEDRLHKRTAW